MRENEKSTDAGLSAAERKELRGREAKEAVADHEAAPQAFHENRERLREERLAREASKGQQKVIVEHVHVYQGGQAIVGNVTTGGSAKNTEVQPHAIGYAQSSEMRCENPNREAVPIAGHG